MCGGMVRRVGVGLVALEFVDGSWKFGDCRTYNAAGRASDQLWKARVVLPHGPGRASRLPSSAGPQNGRAKNAQATFFALILIFKALESERLPAPGKSR